MMRWYGYGWGGMLLMLLSMLLWVAVIALVVWALIKWLSVGTRGTWTPGAGPSGPSAMEIVRRRYARGEIDETASERMRERLEASDSRTGDPLASR
jgi:putative membrane protein